MSRVVHRGDTFKNTILFEFLDRLRKLTTEDTMLITSHVDPGTREFPEIAVEMWLQSANRKDMKF